MNHSILNMVDSTEDDVLWEGTVIRDFKVMNCSCHVMTWSSKVQLMDSRHYIPNRMYSLCLVSLNVVQYFFSLSLLVH